MKILVVTSTAPYGFGERFVVREAIAMQRNGHDVRLLPVHPRSCDRATSELPAFFIGLAAPATLKAGWQVIRNRHLRDTAARVLLSDRRPAVLAKNLAVLGLASRLGTLAINEGIEHIHAAWASTPATVAMLASEFSSVPWSFSAHRWDIREGNLLTLKVRHARFVRTISEWGRSRVARRAGHRMNCPKIQKVHLGVRSDSSNQRRRSADFGNGASQTFTIVSLGNLVPVKGHRYLIEACLIMKRRGLAFRCLLLGDGPERPKLAKLVHRLSVDDRVTLMGACPGEQVDSILASADVCVLPSVVTKSGEHEGIPSALMESMAAGVPVVATDTGSIAELVTDGAGILVEPNSAVAIAEAVERVKGDPVLRASLVRRAYYRVAEAFSEDVSVARLLELMSGANLPCSCVAAPSVVAEPL